MRGTARTLCGKSSRWSMTSTMKGLWKPPTLDSKGLTHVGDILADIAASRPSEYDVGCPYSDPTNRRYWQQNWLRKHQETPAERLERMRREAAGKRRKMH